MRILYVAPFVPWPVRVRSNNIVRGLAMKHDVVVVCAAGSDEEESRAESLRAVCRKVVCVRRSRLRAVMQCGLCLPTPIPLRIAYAFSPAMRDVIKRMIDEFPPDILYVDRWRALPNVPCQVSVPVVCDPTDSMSLYNRRLIRRGAWWERVLGLEEAIKFARYERQSAQRASRVVFCSQLDLDVAAAGSPRARFEVVPNGVDCEKFFFKGSTDDEDPRLLIFTGNFGYRPNFRAAGFFMGHVYPLVRKRISDVRVAFVGNEVDRIAKSRPLPRGIETVGFVPDLRPHIARASVSVVPITVGAGVTNKVLEAFATGTAVVATQMACGDLPVEHGKHLLLAENPESFADAVLRLLSEPGLRRELAANARRFVERDYDLRVVLQKVEVLLLNTVGENRRMEGTHALERSACEV